MGTISREKSSKLISLTMSRHSTSDKGGISISGGWLEGQWIGVKQVHSGSPAAFAGLKEGDSLVNVGEELVIFLETGEVEELLTKAGTELNITIERGSIHPLCVCEETEQRKSLNFDEQNMVTIVIDKEKGVWVRK